MNFNAQALLALKCVLRIAISKAKTSCVTTLHVTSKISHACHKLQKASRLQPTKTSVVGITCLNLVTLQSPLPHRLFRNSKFASYHVVSFFGMENSRPLENSRERAPKAFGPRALIAMKYNSTSMQVVDEKSRSSHQ